MSAVYELRLGSPDGPLLGICASLPSALRERERLAAHGQRVEVVNVTPPAGPGDVPCRLCGQPVTSKDPVAYPYCQGCHYAGSVYEQVTLEPLMRQLRGLEGIRADVWHMGGGLFLLAVRRQDDDPRLMIAVAAGEPDSHGIHHGGEGLPDGPAGPWLCQLFPSLEVFDDPASWDVGMEPWLEDAAPVHGPDGVAGCAQRWLA